MRPLENGIYGHLKPKVDVGNCKSYSVLPQRDPMQVEVHRLGTARVQTKFVSESDKFQKDHQSFINCMSVNPNHC